MSISDEIVLKVSEKVLYPLVPPRPGRRFMFMARNLYEDLQHPPEGEEDRYDELKADLVSFLIERFIAPNYLWLLSPKKLGVWEIRSHRDEPQIRVFGQFANKDVFIAMTFGYRECTDWMSKIRTVQNMWNEIFTEIRPRTTSNVDELFSGAIHERKYFKD